MPGGGDAPQAQQVQPGRAAGSFLFGGRENFQGVADPELQRKIIESEGLSPHSIGYSGLGLSFLENEFPILGKDLPSMSDEMRTTSPKVTEQ